MHAHSPPPAPNTFYSAGTFSCSEHGGTHIDAPFHFYEHGITVDQLPLSTLVSPCRVIKVPQRYILVSDIEFHESQHGVLTRGCAVLFDTDWAGHYPLCAARYLGFDPSLVPRGPTASTPLSFPGLSPAAADLLASRSVGSVGVDTASLDPGHCLDFAAHRALLSKGIYGIEDINAEVRNVPPKGATLMAMPIKITGGSGAPARVVALVPR